MNRRRRSRACHEGTENGTGRPLNATSVCRVWNETREAKRGFILSMHAATRGSREREESARWFAAWVSWRALRLACVQSRIVRPLRRWNEEGRIVIHVAGDGFWRRETWLDEKKTLFLLLSLRRDARHDVVKLYDRCSSLSDRAPWRINVFRKAFCEKRYIQGYVEKNGENVKRRRRSIYDTVEDRSGNIWWRMIAQRKWRFVPSSPGDTFRSLRRNEAV